MLRSADALAEEDESVAIDEHHPDAGAVGELVEGDHGCNRQMEGSEGTIILGDDDIRA